MGQDDGSSVLEAEDTVDQDGGVEVPRALQDVLERLLLTTHDLNNMLMVLGLELGEGLELPTPEALVALQESIRLGRQIADQCRRPAIPLEERPLQRLVKEALSPLRDLLGPQAVLVTHLEEVGSVRVGPHLVANLVRNLVLNGHRASADGSCVEVSLTGEERDHRRWARLCVADAGAGIEPNLLQQLGRDPVESSYGGQGVGLSLLRARLAHIGGELVLESEVGRGTRVAALIPCVDHVR